MSSFLFTGEPWLRAAWEGEMGDSGSPGRDGDPGQTAQFLFRNMCIALPGDGEQGGNGHDGYNGDAGMKGRPAPPGTLDLGIIEGQITIEVGGGQGQTGGKGGLGGAGGSGGRAGYNPIYEGPGIYPPPQPCPSGQAGPMGWGGKGGNGGNAGDGGDGGTVTVYYKSIKSGNIDSKTFFGNPGIPGAAGFGGYSTTGNRGNGRPGFQGSLGSASNVIIRQVP
ncbi:hypothetical protein ACE38W_14035 [Chitinophaga sp. Hz27]|uniref:hypothetical protein n=1 Tax=Chitinophaga sp. Hz27 TaxID=3347169 RepID=UPI0035DCAAA0